jgi:hypothetical protein
MVSDCLNTVLMIMVMTVLLTRNLFSTMRNLGTGCISSLAKEENF